MDVQGKSRPWTEGWVVRWKTVLLSSSAPLNWLVASSHSHTHGHFPMERRSWINKHGPSAPSNTSNKFLPALVLLGFRTNHPKNSWLTGHDYLSQFSLTSLFPLACELQRDKRRFLQFVSIYQLNSCISGAGKEKHLWFVLSFSSLFPFQPCGCERTSHPVAHSGPTQLTELSPPSGWVKVTQKTNRSCLVTYSFGPESVKRVTAPHNPQCSVAWLLLGRAAASSQWDVDELRRGRSSVSPTSSADSAAWFRFQGRSLGALCRPGALQAGGALHQWGALGRIIPTFPSVTEHQLDYTHSNSDLLMMSLAARHYFELLLITVPLTWKK